MRGLSGRWFSSFFSFFVPFDSKKKEKDQHRSPVDNMTDTTGVVGMLATRLREMSTTVGRGRKKVSMEKVRMEPQSVVAIDSACEFSGAFAAVRSLSHSSPPVTFFSCSFFRARWGSFSPPHCVSATSTLVLAGPSSQCTSPDWGLVPPDKNWLYLLVR